MRIITGSAKGLQLKAPRGLNTRPTADKIKGAIFNILGTLVVDAVVLDLFAGTGNLGLEALSRGADKAIFVDHTSTSTSIIKENAIHTKLFARCEIYRADAARSLDKLILQGQRFDLIFCDPPYNQGYVGQVLSRIDGSDILNDEGVVILEHSRHELIDCQWKNINIMRSERYGETMVSFLSQKQEQ